MGNLATTVVLDLLLRERGAVPKANPGADLFPVAKVRQADDVHVGDGWMRVQKLLDFTGIDVLAAADDHVLDAASDAVIAVGSALRQVTRPQPTVGSDGGGRLRRLVVIAFHHAVTTHQQLPGLAVRDRLERPWLDDTHLQAG